MRDELGTYAEAVAYIRHLRWLGGYKNITILGLVIGRYKTPDRGKWTLSKVMRVR